MPLSDHEQRILEEMERKLYEEDRDFAKGMGRADPSLTQTKRVKLGFLSFAAGLITLLAFFVTGALVVGVIAFGAMVTGIVTVATATKNLASAWRILLVSPKERLSGNLANIERRLRERYRRR